MGRGGALTVGQRVLVGGISGAGKTTLARQISARFALPFTEIDGLFHGPGWVERPSFAEDVAAVVGQDRWVVDSLGYAAVRDAMWERADTLVWLDLPRWQVMWRVVRRSAWRGIRRTELWNGNRESLTAWVDPEHPVRWAWRQHAARRTLIHERITDPHWQHLTVVRLRSSREARRWRREHLSRR